MQSSSKQTFNNAVIATQRFSLGARANDLKRIQKIEKQWLLNQLNFQPAVNFNTALPHSNNILKIQSDFRTAQRAYRKKVKEAEKLNLTSDSQNKQQQSAIVKNIKAPKNPNGPLYRKLIQDTLKQAITADNSFNWRCLDFFSNHFSVTAQNSTMRGLCATLEREAIAAHLFSSFEELILAVYQHPAMLIYLNNETSIGPSTRYAKNNRGLNENLAREIMELHTLGVNGGYQQQDVTELAKGITGWSVGRPGKDKKQGFIFRAKMHETGVRTLMGKKYPSDGINQGIQMLKDIANHPNTARFVCTKIIQHFINDQPPEALINHLTHHWHKSHGQLKVVFQALINHPLSWQAPLQKYKTPREYVISTYRAITLKNIPIQQVENALTVLGQRPFQAGSPAGYGDLQEDWDGASALMARINWISNLMTKKRLQKINVKKLIETLFADTLSEHSYQMITRAETRHQALVLLFLSPEFLRR
ncbi:DUF1800 domain-containing protein [Psychromonas aquatilis]|uniref:DUF1800 domain-containing protein n=1 Tax=Psychromonas aquatilis TaxID=2005072 RepID=A0ABU9GPJ3_9GAMM